MLEWVNDMMILLLLHPYSVASLKVSAVFLPYQTGLPYALYLSLD